MTLLSIYNEALSLVGSVRIADPHGVSREAELCDQFYPTVRDQVLIEYDWSCASKIEKLAMTAENVGGFAYSYQLPAAPPLLTIRAVTDENGGDIEYAKWKRQKGLILSDMNPLHLRYTYAVENPLDFDPHVSNAIAYGLASRLAFPLTQSLGLEQTRLQQYAVFLVNAKMLEGVAKQSEDVPPKIWSEVH